MGVSTLNVRCPRCDALVPEAALDRAEARATCPGCAHAFTPPRRETIARRRPPLPPGMTVETGEPALAAEGGYRRAPSRPLVIRRRWRDRTTTWLAPFLGVVGTGAVVVAFAGAVGGGVLDWISAAFMALVPAVFVYGCAAAWLNTTTFEVKDGRLRVQHGPIPWFGEREVRAGSVRQLAVTQQRGLRDPSQVSWELSLETDDGDIVPLLRGLPSREPADYLEWAFEEHLGLEDQPKRNDP